MTAIKCIRIIAIIFVLILCLSLCSCWSVYVQGIDKFSTEVSTVSLTRYIMPEDFLEKFDYIQGDYFYSDESNLKEHYERALIYVEYEEIIYDHAKQYVIENLKLSEDQVYTSNSYIFYENNTAEDDGLDFLSNDMFPCVWMSVAFNDELHRIVFIGFTADDELGDEVETFTNDYGVFLNEYFKEFYDFSEPQVTIPVNQDKRDPRLRK